MKKKIIAGALLLTNAVFGESIADCTNNRVSGGNNLRNLLSGNRICVQNAEGGWESQEEHMSNGQLFDYKLGEGHKVDPRKLLGTWSASNGANAVVTYVYTAFGSVTTGPYAVYLTSGTRGQNGSTYDFCDGGQVVASGILQLGTNAACQ